MRYLFLFILASFLMILIWHSQCNISGNFDLKYSQKQIKLNQLLPNDKTIPIIDEINKDRNQIKNFQSDVTVIAKKDRTVKTNGRIYFDKPTNFRLMLSSFTGSEIDVGSNSKYFWYWSYRDSPSALYYSEHINISKSKLKTPFNPEWLISVIGLNEIKYKNANVDSYNGLWRIVKSENYQGRLVLTCILIDPIKKIIIGASVYDAGSGNCISASEITSFQSVNGFQVAKSITIIWYEENVSLNLIFNYPQINSSINPKFFEMPNLTPKINMGND